MTSLQKTIGAGTFWLSANNWVLKVVGLATIFFTLSNLSLYEYGLVELVLSVIPIFSIFLLPGLMDVVIADMSIERGKGRPGAMKNLLVNFTTLQMLLAVVAWAIVFFGADIIAHFYKGQVADLLRVASFSFLIGPFRSMVLTVLAVYFKFFTQAVFTFTEEVIKFIFIISLVVFLEMGPMGVVLAAVLSELLAVVAISPFFVRMTREIRYAKIEERTPFWSSIQFHGKWSVFSTYLNQFGNKMRLWVIRFTLGTEAVALFAVAEGLIGHTLSLLPIYKVVTPIIPQYVDDKPRFFKIINKSIKYQFLGYLGIGVVGYFLFPPIIVWLFPAYVSSMDLFRVMLLSLIPVSFAAILTPVYFALKAQRDLFFAMILKTILVVTLAPLFILVLGPIGIAYEFVITFTLFMFERYRRLRRLLPDFRISLNDIFTADEMDRVIFGRVLRPVRRVLKK